MPQAGETRNPRVHVDDLYVLDGMPLALVGALEVSRHHDYTTWSEHLQLEVGIVLDYHELGVTWPLEYGAIWSLEIDNFNGECLLLVVYRIAECRKEIYHT